MGPLALPHPDGRMPRNSAALPRTPPAAVAHGGVGDERRGGPSYRRRWTRSAAPGRSEGRAFDFLGMRPSRARQRSGLASRWVEIRGSSCVEPPRISGHPSDGHACMPRICNRRTLASPTFPAPIQPTSPQPHCVLRNGNVRGSLAGEGEDRVGDGRGDGRGGGLADAGGLVGRGGDEVHLHVRHLRSCAAPGSRGSWTAAPGRP